MHCISFVVFCLLITEITSIALNPVCCVNGFASLPVPGFKERCQEIAQMYNGTMMKYISLGDPLVSGRQAYVQMAEVKAQILQFARQFQVPIILIGYSLGGDLVKAILESTPELIVSILVTINSPIGGIDPNGPCENFQQSIEKNLIWGLLTPLVAFAYFLKYGNNDTIEQDLVRDSRKEYSYGTDFIPHFNNINGSCTECQTQFGKVQDKVVFIESDRDGVCFPRQSAHGEFYDTNYTIVSIQQQPMYANNTLMWKTLYEQGRLILTTLPDKGHLEIVMDSGLFATYVTSQLWP